MDENQKNTTAMNIFTVVAILLIVGIPIYGYFKLKPDRIFNMNAQPRKVDNKPVKEEEEKEEKPILITGYTEELVEIGGQWAYILAPEPIDPEDLPTLVIYNHGSNTAVGENLDEEFKQDLIKYGEILTPHNYIFAVSNAQGFDLDAPEAVSDNYNMYEYIKEKYGIKEKIHMIAYSKGGLRTLDFAAQYPELISKIALIAPKLELYEWNQKRASQLMNIGIKIWHGTEDENISFEDNRDFVEQMKLWGIDMTFIPLEGKNHWDIKTQYIDGILQFLSN
jgi:predicted peptidase